MAVQAVRVGQVIVRYHAWQRGRGTWHNMSLDAIIGRVIAPFVRTSTNYEEFFHEGTPQDLRVFRSERRCIDIEIERRALGEGDPAIEECTSEVFEYARSRRMLEDGVETTPGPTGEIQYAMHQDVGAFSESRVQVDGVTFSLSGRMPRQEEGSPEVCTALAHAKTVREGKSWVAEASRHDGDDGCPPRTSACRRGVPARLRPEAPGASDIPRGLACRLHAGNDLLRPSLA